MGRQDDGLGWAFIDWLEEESLCPKADLDKHYQLHLEHADLISQKKRVLFVDATKVPEVESIKLETVDPEMDHSFTSHAISIGAIMETCKMCFDYIPEVQLLTIKGYEWELELGLTSKAQQNLDQAKRFFRENHGANLEQDLQEKIA